MRLRAVWLLWLLFVAAVEAASNFEGSWAEFSRSAAGQRELDPSNVDTNLLNAAILHATNMEREKRELPGLKDSARARRAAAMQARIMRDRGSVSHKNPERSTLRTLEERARAAGLKFRYLAENVATAFDRQYESGRPFYSKIENNREIVSYTRDGPPIPRHTYASFARALVKSWMDSPGHRKNVLNTDAEFMGASALPDPELTAIRKFYCVQVFYTPPPSKTSD